MASTIRTWHLANGLNVEIDDESANYYGDYYNVKLVVRCRITVEAAHVKPLEKRASHPRVAQIMGSFVDYRREIGRAGVAGRDVSFVKGGLLRSFEENALPYFSREDFAEKFVKKRYAEIEKDLSEKGHGRRRNGD